MTVRDLIKALSEFPPDLPVVDYEGGEISIVRMNDDPWYDVAGESYEGDPYIVIL